MPKYFPTYLPNQKIQDRGTANKQVFKDGLIAILLFLYSVSHLSVNFLHRFSCLMPNAVLWISFAPKIYGWFIIFVSFQNLEQQLYGKLV